MDPPFFVRLQYVAMTQFTYFLFFRTFFSVTFLKMLHVSDPVLCSRRIVPSRSFIRIVFSVPCILPGAGHFQRCFELDEYLLVDPIFGLLCYG